MLQTRTARVPLLTRAEKPHSGTLQRFAQNVFSDDVAFQVFANDGNLLTEIEQHEVRNLAQRLQDDVRVFSCAGSVTRYSRRPRHSPHQLLTKDLS